MYRNGQPFKLTLRAWSGGDLVYDALQGIWLQSCHKEWSKTIVRNRVSANGVDCRTEDWAAHADRKVQVAEEELSYVLSEAFFHICTFMNARSCSRVEAR